MPKQQESALEGVFGLRGQVAIVTGAGRGIGRAIALDLARAGASVALVGRSSEPIRETSELVEQAGGRSLVAVCDVTREAEAAAMAETTLAAFGRVDVLVNNAGVGHSGQIDTTTLTDWGTVLDTNLTGAFVCTKAVLAVMRGQGGGVVVNIASISGQTGGLSASAPYAASKGGLIAFTKALARQMAPFGGRANAVAPGQIDTRMSVVDPERLRVVRGMTPLGRLGTPEEVAHAVLFLASPAASFITGHVLNVNGGILMD
ncbi:MAG: SDR family NAD(P)-dependent oxidoreductase [Chloroflexota bacterium]